MGQQPGSDGSSRLYVHLTGLHLGEDSNTAPLSGRQAHWDLCLSPQLLISQELSPHVTSLAMTQTPLHTGSESLKADAVDLFGLKLVQSCCDCSCRPLRFRGEGATLEHDSRELQFPGGQQVTQPASPDTS